VQQLVAHAAGNRLDERVLPGLPGSHVVGGGAREAAPVAQRLGDHLAGPLSIGRNVGTPRVGDELVE